MGKLKPRTMPLNSVKECLDALGVPVGNLAGCANVSDEWSVIKKTYFRKILKCHPDKGGSTEEFRHVQAAFEGLRLMYDTGPASFTSALNHSVDGTRMADFAGRSAPSWEYYEAAAEAVVPKYRVEPAKTGRSSCKATGVGKHCMDETIEQGSLRVGMLDDQSGGYGRWVHLTCWRVPSKVWLGTQSLFDDVAKIEDTLISMNEVLFCGLGDLDKFSRRAVAAHVCDKANHAKLIRSRSTGQYPTGEEYKSGMVRSSPDGSTGAPGRTSIVPGCSGSREVVLQQKVFTIPRPGRDGRPGSMNLCNCNLTGIFPEVGGGVGLHLGKDRVTAMIESFGGKVTGAVSGKTNILVVGKEPGYSAIVAARTSKRIRLISLEDLADCLRRGVVQIGQSGLACPTVEIADFSDGWHGNSAAKTASAGELEFARRGDGTQLAHRAKQGAIMGTPGGPSRAVARTGTPGSIVKFQKPPAPEWSDYAAVGWKRLTSPSRPGQVMYLAPDGSRHKTLPPLKISVTPVANQNRTPGNTGVKREAEPQSWAGKKAMTKTFLYVPFDEKDRIKRMGARWDQLEKKWYIVAGRELEHFAQFLTPQALGSPAKRAKI